MFSKKTPLAIAALMIPLLGSSSLKTHAADTAPASQQAKKETAPSRPSRFSGDSSWIKQPKEETSSEKAAREAREARLKELEEIRAARSKQTDVNVKSSLPSTTHVKPSEKADASYGLKSSKEFPHMGRTQHALVNKMGENVKNPNEASTASKSNEPESGLTPVEESTHMGSTQKELIARMKAKREAAATHTAKPETSAKAHAVPPALKPLELTKEEESIHLGSSQKRLMDSLKGKKADHAQEKEKPETPAKAHAEPPALEPLELTKEEESIHLGKTQRKLIDSMKAKPAESHHTTPHHAPDAPKAEHIHEEQTTTTLTLDPTKLPPKHHAPETPKAEPVHEEETTTLTLDTSKLPPPPPPAPPAPPPGPLVKPQPHVSGESTLAQIAKGKELKKTDGPHAYMSSRDEMLDKIRGGKYKLKPVDIQENLPPPPPRPSSSTSSSTAASTTTPLTTDKPDEKSTMKGVLGEINKGGFALKKVDPTKDHPSQKERKITPEVEGEESHPTDKTWNNRSALLDQLKAKGKDIQEGKSGLRKQETSPAPEINLDEIPTN
ncbi:MAG: hypothetical protein FJX71_04685 [Alphaproteobacteria bacterium]|nr:hypothetical protein [Alphaproteobacteria bacterium]